MESENKDLRNIVAAIALVMGFVFVVSLSIYIVREKYGLSCSCKVMLPIIIAVLTSLGVFVGILTYYFLSKSFSKEKEKILGDVEKTLGFLHDEERTIVLALIKNKGEIAQNTLASATKISPVKLHRKLLRLESKGVLRKKKSGMTNKILLEEDFRKLFVK